MRNKILRGRKNTYVDESIRVAEDPIVEIVQITGDANSTEYYKDDLEVKTVSMSTLLREAVCQKGCTYVCCHQEIIIQPPGSSNACSHKHPKTDHNSGHNNEHRTNPDILARDPVDIEHQTADRRCHADF